MASIQRNYGSYGSYDLLLARVVELRKRHESRAKDFVPKMYAVLVEREGLAPKDAADRIYTDLARIWEKDTIRRLLPVEAKDQSARERQTLSRLHLNAAAATISGSCKALAGSILQTGQSAGNARTVGGEGGKGDERAATALGVAAAAGNGEATSPPPPPSSSPSSSTVATTVANATAETVADLEQQNENLRKGVETLQEERQVLLAKVLRLESAVVTMQYRSISQASNKERDGRQIGPDSHHHHPDLQEQEMRMTVMLPPALFMKTFTYMRNSTKPLTLKMSGQEVVEVERM